MSSSPSERPWNKDVLYFTLVDRFFDGDPANNVPAGSDPALYDKAQTVTEKYHGGDFRGLELAIQSGYFTALGVTTIWITPPVRNVWNSSHDPGGAKTGYHGYWAQDFLDIDPHLVSAKSLAGKPYADSRDGRMQHYKDFVALAHQHGLKIVQDAVCNHAGPVFFYDANGNGTFDVADKAEWIQPFIREGFHENAQWADLPKWNLRRTEPTGPVTILGQAIPTTGVLGELTTYGRKGFSDKSLGKKDGEEMTCDFFSLRDIWTAPTGAHFSRLVDEFVEIYAFYIEQIGVDGLRLDTVKHVHHAFWDAFSERLRKRLGERAAKLFLFGEVYDGDPAKVGQYTYRSDYPTRKEPAFDGLLNFPFCFAARDYLRPTLGPFGESKNLERALRTVTGGGGGRPFYNPARGLDGLNSQQKVVNFVENHDGLNRFRVGPINERQNMLAQALTLMAEGIPCIYYGTEFPLHDAAGKIGKDGESGRLTFIPAGKPERFTELPKSPNFQNLALLIAQRRELRALTEGSLSQVWSDSPKGASDDGVFVFARSVAKGDGYDRDATAVVALNPSERARNTAVPGSVMKLVGGSGKPLLIPGDKLQKIAPANGGVQPTLEPMWIGGLPQLELVLQPQSVNLYRIVAAEPGAPLPIMHPAPATPVPKPPKAAPPKPAAAPITNPVPVAPKPAPPPPTAAGPTLVGFTFDISDGADPSSTAYLSPTTVAEGVVGNPITAPNGSIGIEASSADPTPEGAPFLRVTPSGATTAAQAVSEDRFLEFSVAPKPGFSLNLTAMTFNVARGGAGTPRGSAIRSSVDAFAKDIVSADIPTARPAYTRIMVDLTGAGFQNVKKPIVFRIYSYSPSGGSSVDYDDVRIHGTSVKAKN